MKTKTLVCGVVFFVVVVVGVHIFADDKEKYGVYIPGAYEEIFGSWVNNDYASIPPPRNCVYPQKMIYYRWGYCEYFVKLGDKVPFKLTSAIIDKWIDSQGNFWFKSYDREIDSSRAMLCLYKINADKLILENVWSYSDFPSEDDLNSKNQDFYYRIYYRQ
jgi:hypothetical protein